MKNLSKRNKTFLGIGGGIVVLAVLVGIFFSSTGGGGLFGGSIGISPATMSLAIGQSGTITTNHSKTICKWSNSNSTAVTIVSSGDHTANIRGIGAGSATIKETCGAAGNYTGSSVVTVVQPTIKIVNISNMMDAYLCNTSGVILSTCGSGTCTIPITYGATYYVVEHQDTWGHPSSITGCPVGTYQSTRDNSGLWWIQCPNFTVNALSYSVTFNP